MLNVSIVIPVYNVASFLKRCLDSCLRQAVNDYEVIAVDDGSQDGSGQILDDYARKDGRLKIIHKDNEGVVAARERGLEIATGTWILFVDADDWLPDNAIKALLSGVGEDIDIVAADHILAKDGKETLRRIDFESTRLTGPDYVNQCMRKHHGYIWGKLYRRSMFSKVHIDRRFTQNEDYLMNVQLGALARSVAYVCAPVYFYYWDSSADRSKKYSKSRGVYSNINVHKQVVAFLRDRKDLRFILNDGYLTYLLHNVAIGITCADYWPEFLFFKKELQETFGRVPGKLLRMIFKHVEMMPAYLVCLVSIRMARIVQRFYSPFFRVVVAVYMKWRRR